MVINFVALLILSKVQLMEKVELVVQMVIANIQKVKMKMAHHLQKDQKVKVLLLLILPQDKILILHHLKVVITERSKKKRKILFLMHRTLNQHILRQLKMQWDLVH
jgi:hypothetical protein